MSVLEFSPKVLALPVIHGSGDFAIEVRRVMLSESFDCVAVPLPGSFRAHVEEAIGVLPQPLLVTQAEVPQFSAGGDWSPHDDEDTHDSAADAWKGSDEQPTHSYVPIDPCQPVIAALRAAIGEHIPRAYIDLETARYLPWTATLPDAYALKNVSLERFAAAVLPAIPRPEGQAQARVAHMAARLRQLEKKHQRVLFVCSVLDWPWVREAFVENHSVEAEDDLVEETTIYHPNAKTLLFLLGELPFITGLYERARAELESDENLSVDGVKELLLSTRDHYKADFRSRARKITPHLLRTCLKYIRNLSLIERRFTPDLYTLVTAAKQIAGDQFALHLAETARDYPFTNFSGYPETTLSVDRARLPDGQTVKLVSRLPGPPLVWRSLQLQRRPDKAEREQWAMKWNPHSQCSWPPEDELIENFRAAVFDKAKAIMGADLIKTEKFTTSIKDGIDIRDTLRNWHTGEIYVKVLPPNRGRMDCAIMLFDAPADPRDYPWRTTWFSEHPEESTLAFFATDFSKETVGPGIALATYGGAMFLFPPVPIHDVWRDPRLDFCDTLEERLIAAGCIHSECPHVALLSHYPPGAGWRRLAKQFGRKLVHVPLAQFSESTVQQLRMVHVLNGKQVRSYAAHFIRKA